MKIVRIERHDKGNKNDSSYAIINLNKICHEVKNINTSLIQNSKS